MLPVLLINKERSCALVRSARVKVALDLGEVGARVLIAEQALVLRTLLLQLLRQLSIAPIQVSDLLVQSFDLLVTRGPICQGDILVHMLIDVVEQCILLFIECFDLFAQCFQLRWKALVALRFGGSRR